MILHFNTEKEAVSWAIAATCELQPRIKFAEKMYPCNFYAHEKRVKGQVRWAIGQRLCCAACLVLPKHCVFHHTAETQLGYDAILHLSAHYPIRVVIGSQKPAKTKREKK